MGGSSGGDDRGDERDDYDPRDNYDPVDERRRAGPLLRKAILLAMIGFMILFTVTTVYVVFEQGFDIFVLAAIPILAILTIGLTGAFLYHDDDDHGSPGA